MSGIASDGAVASEMPLARPVFLYDGDCGPCDAAITMMRNRIAQAVEFVPYQGADIAALGVSEAEVLTSPVLVWPDGSHTVGPAAMSGMMMTARNPFRTIGRVMGAPGPRHVLGVLQPIMYRNRHRMPGGTDACRIPVSAEHPWVAAERSGVVTTRRRSR